MHLLLTGVLAFAGAWAVVSDFKYRRISNYVTVGAALAALIIRLGLGGPTAALVGLTGWLAGLALFFVPFALGWMGAGDVKLLAAFGALGGPVFVLETALFGCLAGGVMSVMYLVREHRFWFTLQHLYVFVLHPSAGTLSVKRRMPFGPALAAGAAASMLLARNVAGKP